VFVVVVGKAEIERSQAQWRGAALLVYPFDLGVADQDLLLAQHPVGQAAVALLLGEAYAGHRDTALHVATHRELEVVDFEGVQAQVHEQQGTPGDHVDHAGQQQRLAALLVEQPHVDQIELRPQAAPVGADGLDGDRQADGPGDRRHDVVPIAFDVGQQPVAQAEKEHRDQEERGPQKDLDRTQEDAHAGHGVARGEFPAAGRGAFRHWVRARAGVRPGLHGFIVTAKPAPDTLARPSEARALRS
jgi:hypothetical protein